MPAQIRKIHDLAARGRTPRDIARVLGVGRYQVLRALAGEYGLVTRSIEPRRCPTCRGLVRIWPCLLCAARREAVPARRR
jgi:hypothetical protein